MNTMITSKKYSIVKKIVLSVGFLFLISQSLCAQNYIIGADLSFMKEAEDNGFKFKESQQIKPCIQIFKEHGYNWVRLRLFHRPTQLPNNLRIFRRCKQNNFECTRQ